MRFVSYMRRSAKILILNKVKKRIHAFKEKNHGKNHGKKSSKKFPMIVAPMSR